MSAGDGSKAGLLNIDDVLGAGLKWDVMLCWLLTFSCSTPLGCRGLELRMNRVDLFSFFCPDHGDYNISVRQTVMMPFYKILSRFSVISAMAKKGLGSIGLSRCLLLLRDIHDGFSVVVVFARSADIACWRAALHLVRFATRSPLAHSLIR